MSRTRKKWMFRLMEALELGDLNSFTAIITDVSRPVRDPNHPFWHSCLAAASRVDGGHEFIRALLGAGVRPCAAPIHLACREGLDENLKALLEHRRTDVNVVDGSGRSALHHLAIGFDEARPGYFRCLDLLLSRPDLDVNLPNKRGFTALHEAANRGSVTFVRTVLSSHASLDLDQSFALGRTARDAILRLSPSLSSLLPPVRRDVLDPSSDPQARLLHFLRKRRLKDFVRLLYMVDDGLRPLVNPDFWYENHHTTCLLEATRSLVSEEYVGYLLKAGANPNIADPTDGSVALHVAVSKHNFPAIKLLAIYEKTDINATNFRGETALHLAVKYHGGTEHCEVCLRILLRHPSIDVNKMDVAGETATVMTSMKGDETARRLLLSHSNNLFVFCENSNETVGDVVVKNYLHTEKENGNLNNKAFDKLTVKEQLVEYITGNDIMSFLALFKLNVKSDKDILDFRIGEETILQYACKWGLVDIVNALLKHGADPNLLKYANRKPPLIITVEYQQHSILSLLLKHHRKTGLNVNIADERGNTSLYYASINEDLHAVVEVLRHGANLNQRNVYGKLVLATSMLGKVLNYSITSSEHHEHDSDYRLYFDYTPIANYANEITTIPSVSEDQIWLRIDSAAESGETSRCSKRKESEMEFFNCVSGCSEYRELLLHPVITLFLDLKWSRLKIIFYIRLILYAVFVVLLNTYILMCDLKTGRDQKLETSEIEAGHNLSAVNDDGAPAEWSRTKTFFMSALFLVLFLATMVDTAVTMYKIPLRLIKPCRVSVSPGATRTMLRFGRVLDLSVNVFTSVFLYKIRAESVQQLSAVIIILCSWTKLMLLLANFRKHVPSVKLLESILNRHAPSLLPYYLLVIGFAFSFFILLNDEEYFHSPWTSLFKTTMMLTGEFKLRGVMFSLNPVVSHLVFLLFIVLILIIVLNVLSIFLDSADEVRRNALLLQIQDKVELLSELESFLIRLRKIKIFNRFFRCSNYVNNWFQNIFIFQENSNKIISVFPNKSKLLQLAGKNFDVNIDDNIIKPALMLASSKENLRV